MPTQKLLKDLLLEDQEEEPLYLNKRSRTGRFRVFRTVLKRLKSRRSRYRSRTVENGVGVERANAVMVVAGENGVCDDGDFRVPMSPSSPFRFTLEGSGNGADCESPCFGSPASSPAHKQYQGTQSCVIENTVKFQTEVEGEEEKEQNSPVSVLDPPHEDGDERDDDRDHGEENGYDYDHQCSYAFAQKSKKKSLHKHHQFQMLAELNPFELEKRTQAQERECNRDKSIRPEETLLEDNFRQLDFHGLQKPGMKRLIFHLINKEEEDQRRLKHSDSGMIDTLVKRVCKRLETWQNVDPSTTEMMSRTELGGESGDWWKPSEQITQVVVEILAEIFCKLVEEIVEDLI
ncbi:hypothetical protein Droror1_Dr00013834 [Drosera rotundifolia]